MTHSERLSAHETTPKRAKERRWIVLGTDGRYVTLGRHTDPSEAEIAAAAAALTAQGLAGWLAIMEGDYWSERAALALLMVRPLAGPDGAFAEAVAAFEAARRRALAQT